ncbi:MAG: type III secretion system export apparatus subunit SctU [Noviherbaspirillum sp.]
MSSEKTEQPTPHKIRKAREDGQVAKSKDFTQVLLLGAMLGYTLANSGAIVRDIMQILLFPTQLYGMDFRAAVSSAISELTKSGVMLLVPYLLLGLVVGIFGETIQTGILFAFKALIPKGSKLNPASNLKQMFSMKNVVEFIKSSLKVIFLSTVVYVVIRGLLDPLLKLPYQDIDEAGFMLGEMLKKLVVYTFIGFGAIALLDLVYQRKRYTKDLMMSMQEIKQEYKQLEGDPHVKSHRRGMAKEIAMGDGERKARKATVVVTNPIHFAVALYYRREETPLPVVLAKGADAAAKEIVRIAREENIPVMENVPLARALMATADVDKYIPSELVEPVAEVLLALRRMARERAEREGVQGYEDNEAGGDDD